MAERRRGPGSDNQRTHWADGEDTKKEAVSLPCAAALVLGLMLLSSAAVLFVSSTQAEREQHLNAFSKYARSTSEDVAATLADTHSYLNAPLEKHEVLPSNGGNAARTAAYAKLSLFEGHAPYERQEDSRIAKGAFLKKELTEGHFHEEYIPQNYTFPYPGVRYLVQALAHAAAERVAQALPLSWRNELHQNAERSLHVPVFYFGRPDQATVLSARELITEHNLITSAFEHMRHSVQLKPVGLGITKIGSLVMLFHDVTDVKSGGEHAVDMLRNTLRKQTPYTLTHQSRTLLHVTLWRCFSKDALTETEGQKLELQLREENTALASLGPVAIDEAWYLWERSWMSAWGEVEVLKWGHGLGAGVAAPRHATQYEAHQKPDTSSDPQTALSGALMHPKGKIGEEADRLHLRKSAGGLQAFINGFLGR